MATNSTYTVSGMTCGSCASKVTDHVEQIDGVTDVAVDISTGSLMVTTDAPVTITAASSPVAGKAELHETVGEVGEQPRGGVPVQRRAGDQPRQRLPVGERA